MAAARRSLPARLPKVDLHCHLDGSLRWDTVRELAPGAGVRLPDGAPESLRAWRGADPSCRSLDGVLEMFRYLVPLLRRGPNLERAACELLEDCARDNIRYVEVRYAPVLCAGPGFTAADSVAAVLKGLERGRRRTGVEARVILCLLRGQSAAESRETLRLARLYFGKGVAGLDLAGTESSPTRDYAPYFEAARAAGLGLTCHAGETAAREHLESALAFGVSRIGHGTGLRREPALLEQVRRRGICLEVSLSSNLATGAVPGLERHPFLEFLRGGAAVALSTDDKGVFGIDLTHEYALAARAGATPAELGALALAGAEHAFLPPAQRRRLAARMKKELRTKMAELRERAVPAPALSS